jgi:hypothetical protein
VHRQLKNDWQDFHGREDAIIIFTFAATWQWFSALYVSEQDSVIRISVLWFQTN